MNTDITQDLQNNVNNTLGGINFGILDNIANGLGNLNFNLFGGDNFATRIGRILSGEYMNDYPNMFQALVRLFGGVILDVLPIVVLIVAIAILSGFVKNLRTQNNSEGVRDVVHFVTYAAVIVLVMYTVASLVATTTSALNSIRAQMDAVFPILLTLVASIGGAASVGVYQPAVVMLSQGVMTIFTVVVMPLFIITLTFSVVGNLSSTTRFDKFVSFFTATFKWTIGIVFTIFLAIITIQGISAGVTDGISLRAARFTISSYVPFLGGYLSQGFDMVLASSVLIKNAVGVGALYLLLGVVLAPIAKILIFSLALKLAAAITQPIGDERISNFLTSINKAFSMLLAILIAVSFMYFITVGLVIVSGNIL